MCQSCEPTDPNASEWFGAANPFGENLAPGTADYALAVVERDGYLAAVAEYAAAAFELMINRELFPDSEAAARYAYVEEFGQANLDRALSIHDAAGLTSWI